LDAQYPTISFDHYTTADGLSNKEVTDIAQDEEGFIWIATTGGLNRFDGKDFVKYYSTGSQNNLPSNDIIHIVCLALHRLVVGTAGGIGILDTHTGITRQLIIPSVDELKIYTNRITDIVVDSSNNIIVTTYTGIYVFDQSFKLVYRYDAYSAGDVMKKRIVFAYTLYLLQNKNVLVPGLNNFFVLDIKKRKLESIDHLKGDQWEFLKQWEKNPFLLLEWNPHGQGFLIDYDAHTTNLCLNLLDLLNQKNTSLSLPSPPGLINELSWKSRLFFLNDSMFAINSSHQNGLYLFHLNSQKPSVKYEGKLLSDIQCNWSFVDKKGRLWVGADEGIFKQSFSKNAFHNSSTPAIGKIRDIDNFVSGFSHVHNILFVSIHSQGVLLYDENGNFLRRIGFESLGKLNLPLSISPYNHDTLLIPTQIGALLLHSGNYGLRKFWQPGMSAVIDGLAITANLIDSHHQLWMGMGSGFGVFMFNMDTRIWKLFSPTAGQNAFPLRYPKSINEDKWGNIWMSGTEGITRWNWQKKIFDTLIQKVPGLPDDITGEWNYTTTDKEGNIWICPEDFVLVKWNLKTNKINIFKRPENVAPFKASQINGPWNNRLWIKTNIGLVSFNVITEKFNLLKKNDGLPDENVSDGGLYYDSVSHRLYVGFNNAFTWFYPNEVLQQKQPTITYITDIRKIGDTVSYAGNANLKFSHNNNSISISYTGINFDKGESNTYAYRLFEGKPSGWINVADQKTLNFANLKPGAYTFQVKTILSDGTESLQPASIVLTISPAYYQTWWFYMLCIIVVIACIYALYRYRINQLLHLQKVRDSISSDLHDDIGARLTNINILTMLGKQNVKQPEMTSSYLKRIANEIQSSGAALDDIVWSINSRNDLLPEIIARMRRYAADIFDTTNISFQFNSDKNLSNRSLGMEQRRDLFLVYKEAINNIQKHAKATIVQINLIAEKKCLRLIITDNGIGFDSSKPTSRNGIKNMNSRIAKWKGDFNITSSSASGTTITLSVPDKYANR
jgi:two-component sensor histidine kinase/sugar lactone lactonase YvrE